METPNNPAEMVADLRRRAKMARERAEQYEAAATTLERVYLKSPSASGNGDQQGSGSRRGDRFRQAVEYLAKHGPTKRSDLIEKTGVPQGTVSHILNDKEIFQQDDAGRWFLTDAGAKYSEGSP